MSVLELKEKARLSLESIDDASMLEEIVAFLESEVEYSRTGVMRLTAAQKAGIQAGLDDFAAGRVVSHEEVMKELDRLLADDE